MLKFFASIVLSFILLVGCGGTAGVDQTQKDIQDAIYEETGIDILLLEGYQVSAIAAIANPFEEHGYSEIQVAYYKSDVTEEGYTSEDVIEDILETAETGRNFTHVGEKGIAIAYRPGTAVDTSGRDGSIEVLGETVGFIKASGLTLYSFNHNEQYLTISVLDEVYTEEDVVQIIEKILE